MKFIRIIKGRIKNINAPFLVMSLLIMVSLACGFSVPAQPDQAANPSGTAISTDQAEQTNSIEGTVGSSRGNPIPYSDSIVSVPGWDIQFLEVVRGDDAISMLETANGFKPPIRDDRDDEEILLLKLHIKSTHSDNKENHANFQLTGDHLVRYDPFIPVPLLKPELVGQGVPNGGEAEGWIGCVIGKGEGNLLLISSDLKIKSILYIALEEGASVAVPQELKDIQPTDLGRDQANPALRTETVTAEDWQVSVTDVFRGEEAWQKLEQASPFNRRAKEGTEYILIKVHVRYIGTKDEATPQLDFNSFKLIGSQNILYDAPSFMDIQSPEPFLQVRLFPGGEYEGWLVMQAAQDETGLILVFDPEFDKDGQNKRYIFLES